MTDDVRPDPPEPDEIEPTDNSTGAPTPPPEVPDEDEAAEVGTGPGS